MRLSYGLNTIFISTTSVTRVELKYCITWIENGCTRRAGGVYVQNFCVLNSPPKELSKCTWLKFNACISFHVYGNLCLLPLPDAELRAGVLVPARGWLGSVCTFDCGLGTRWHWEPK